MSSVVCGHFMRLLPVGVRVHDAVAVGACAPEHKHLYFKIDVRYGQDEIRAVCNSGCQYALAAYSAELSAIQSYFINMCRPARVESYVGVCREKLLLEFSAVAHGAALDVVPAAEVVSLFRRVLQNHSVTHRGVNRRYVFSARCVKR